MRLQRPLDSQPPGGVPDINTIPGPELESFINEKLKGKLAKNCCMHMGDFKYYLPPLKDAEEIIKGSKIKEMTRSRVRANKPYFDCDDFAILLKSRYAHAVYREPKYLNYSHCFGIVWGMLPYPLPHSLNWMVTDDQRLHFVEPQTEKIMSSEEDWEYFRYIHLLLV